MKMKYQDMLPIGSVVMLEGATKKLMITGITPMVQEPEVKIYDYIGVLFPEGYIGDQVGNYMFNHEDINDVVFRGYDNPERERFLKSLDEKGMGCLRT